MRRFRLSTLMLLIVIAALCIALVVEHDRASRRIAYLEAVAAPTLKSSEMVAEKRGAELQIMRQTKGLNASRSGEGQDRGKGIDESDDLFASLPNGYLLQRLSARGGPPPGSARSREPAQPAASGMHGSP